MTALACSLTSPEEPETRLFNFTTFEYNTQVAVGNQAAFLYRMPIDSRHEPRQFGLVLELFYIDEHGRRYYDRVFEGTFEIVDSLDSMDPQTALLYFASVMGALVFAYLIYSFSGNSSSGASKVETGTDGAADDDFLEGSLLKSSGSKSPKAWG